MADLFLCPCRTSLRATWHTESVRSVVRLALVPSGLASGSTLKLGLRPIRPAALNSGGGLRRQESRMAVRRRALAMHGGLGLHYQELCPQQATERYREPSPARWQ